MIPIILDDTTPIPFEQFDFSRFQYIIFDFDGVLADTNNIRINGFRTLFQDFPAQDVKEMVDFAKINGGLSRHAKIRYFFEEIRKEPIDTPKVAELTSRFSSLVKQKVIDADAIEGSIEFLKKNSSPVYFALSFGCCPML